MRTSCKTVGELRKALEQFPDHTQIAIDGPDVGGYDVTYCPIASVGTIDDVLHPQNEDYKWFARHNLVFISGELAERTLPEQFKDDWFDILNREGRRS